MNKKGRPKGSQLYDSFGVYTITCLENSRIYVGSSSTVYNRVCNQKCRLRKAHPACIPSLLADFQRFGERAFKFEIIRHCENISEALEHEQSLMDYYRSTGLLYNIHNAIDYKERERCRNSPNQTIPYSLYLREDQIKWLAIISKKEKVSRSFYVEKLIDNAMNHQQPKETDNDR